MTVDAAASTTATNFVLGDPKRAARILIVDDVLSNALLLKGYTAGLGGVEAVTFTDPTEALRWCTENEPDLVMLDYLMPQMDGIEFLRRFRRIEGQRDIPVIVIAAEENREALFEALDAGANDFLRKPVDHIELIARAQNMLQLHARHLELAELNKKLYTLGTTDALTGVANRRRFLEVLGDELERGRRYGRHCSLAMVDADNFQKINDSFGPDVGDSVLRALARALLDVSRKNDQVGRLGGGEFAVLLSETNSGRGEIACLRLLTAVRKITIDTDVEPVIVTVCIGLADACRDDDVGSLLKRADTALYRAKTSGKDCVAVAH